MSLFFLFPLPFQPGVDHELTEVQRVLIEETFNFANFSVYSLLFDFIDVLVHLLDHLCSLILSRLLLLLVLLLLLFSRFFRIFLGLLAHGLCLVLEVRGIGL